MIVKLTQQQKRLDGELIGERMAWAAEVRFCGTITVISRWELAVFYLL
jgi:hypothetical protein